MNLRGWLKRLERDAREEMIEVPQPDGTVKRFPQSAGVEALLCIMHGRDHPLAQAVRDSPDPKWEKSVYNAFPIDPDEIPDLSE